MIILELVCSDDDSAFPRHGAGYLRFCPQPCTGESLKHPHARFSSCQGRQLRTHNLLFPAAISGLKLGVFLQKLQIG